MSLVDKESLKAEGWNTQQGFPRWCPPWQLGMPWSECLIPKRTLHSSELPDHSFLGSQNTGMVVLLVIFFQSYEKYPILEKHLKEGGCHWPLQGREVQHWEHRQPQQQNEAPQHISGCQGSESPRIGVWLASLRTELSDLQLWLAAKLLSKIPQPPQTVPPARDQVFKLMSLGVTLLKS